MKEWTVSRRQLSELKPAAYNPRRISDKAMAGLSESIRRFGMVEPIVWNRRTGNIVGGHQRHKALEESGVGEVDVVEVDLEEADERALNLALNNPGSRGEFTASAKGLLDKLEREVGEAFGSLLLDDLRYLVERLKVSSDMDRSRAGGKKDGEKQEKGGLECPRCHCAWDSETGRIFRRGLS
jgi:ParB-like chromosome segregation protein Spo0J